MSFNNARENDVIAKHDAAPDNGNLSQQVFANPVDFMNTLKVMVAKESKENPIGVTQDDLYKLAQSADTAKERSAAKIAADHFGEISTMSTSFDVRDLNSKWISNKDMKYNLDMTTGKIEADLNDRAKFETIAGWSSAGLTLAGVVGAVFTSEVPFVSGGILGLTMGSAVATYEYGMRGMTIHERVNAQAGYDKQMLSQWPEINGGSHR